jgi:hypothetical protein
VFEKESIFGHTVMCFQCQNSTFYLVIKLLLNPRKENANTVTVTHISPQIKKELGFNVYLYFKCKVQAVCSAA